MNSTESPEVSDEKLKKVLSGAGVLAGITGLQFVIGLVTQVLIARLLTPEELGIAALAIVVSFLFVTIGNLSGDKYYIYKGRDLNEIITMELLISILAIASGLCIIYIVGYDGKNEHVAFLLLACLYAPLSRPKAVFERQLDFYRARRSYFLGQVFGAGLGVLSAYQGLGVWSVLIWKVTSLYLELVFFNIFNPYKYRIELPSKVNAINLVRFCLPLTLSAVAVYFYSNIDYLLVSRLLDPKSLGFYWFGYQISNYLLQARKVVVTIATPSLLSIDDPLLVSRSVVLVTSFLVSVYSIPSLIIFISGDFLIPMVLGAQWIEAVKLFQIFSLVIVVKVTTAMLEPLMIRSSATQNLLKITLLSCLMLPILGYAGILHFGMDGMGWALLLSSAVTMVYGLKMMKPEILDDDFKVIVIDLLYIITSFLLSLGMYYLLLTITDLPLLAGCFALILYLFILFKINKDVVFILLKRVGL